MTAFDILCCRNYKLRREAAILELEQRGQKRVCFGNEMEKLEEEVIKNCRLLRVRADRRVLRRKVRSDISIDSRNAYRVIISKTNYHSGEDTKPNQVMGPPQYCQQ